MNNGAPVRRGRRSIFRGKDYRIVGMISDDALAGFERARLALARMARCDVGAVSDGDTLEFLSRGEKDARDYIFRNQARTQL